MFGMIKHLFGCYLMMGLEEDWLLYHSCTYAGKPNLVYRIYKAVNREFRLEANEYILSGADLFQYKTKFDKRFGRLFLSE